jgi:hypothetical protein
LIVKRESELAVFDVTLDVHLRNSTTEMRE